MSELPFERDLDSPHRLYLASAGTGKTYKLTGHFLKLLLEGAEPGGILATTFTRKAAGEILDRVLQRLVDGATDPKKLEDLSRNVGIAVTAEDCSALLTRLVRQLDRLQVRTIDAFFVQLGKLFALDLGLPAGWSIADEQQEEGLRREAMARLIAELEPEQLLQLLRDITRKDGGRSIYASMLGVVKEGREAWLDSEEGAWEGLQVPDGLTEERLAEIEAGIRAFECPLTKGGTPRKHWQKDLQRMVDVIVERRWRELNGSGLALKVAEGEQRYDRVDIPEELLALIEELQIQVAHVLLTELQEQTRSYAELLRRFEETYSALQKERALFGFGDVPRALAGSGGELPLKERDLDLSYRLDARIENLLLDEFQDTAPQQWRILQPSADELLSTLDPARTFFCVGDVKQSIYGWRSAEPRLLPALEREGVLEPESLAKSYRSSGVVIDTVNRVFLGIENDPRLQEPGRRQGTIEWMKGFEPHETAKSLPGAALLLQAAEKPEGGSVAEQTMQLAVERIVALQEEAPAATIGVLVRTNRPIPDLINRLLKRGIAASGEGGNPLTDSTAVLHLVSLLHLADHPGDSAAALHVQHSPLGEELCRRHDELREGFTSQRVSKQLRRALFGEGLGLFCAGFLTPVLESEQYGEWDRRRFRQAVDLAFAYEPRLGLRADDFVEYLRTRRVEDPAASQVKVMTVHASKGLEFDVVLLPELFKSLAKDRTRVLTRRSDVLGRFDRVCLRPGKALVRLDAGLEELHEEHVARLFSEHLSVLYVALTRAKRRIEMIVPHLGATNTSDAVSFANLLRDRLLTQDTDAAGGSGGEQEGGAQATDQTVLWRHPESSDEWMKGIEEEQAAEAVKSPELRLRSSAGPRELPSRAPSTHVGAEVRGNQLLQEYTPGAALRGTVLHEWFSTIEWLPEADLADDRLLALVAHLEPDEGSRRELLEEFTGAIGRPAVREVLTRPADAGQLEVWREREFSIVLPVEGAEGEEFLASGAFDRVVLERDDRGELVRATILDFKSDHVQGAEIQQRAEHYRGQLEAYRVALAHMTGLAPERIITELLFLHPGEVVRL